MVVVQEVDRKVCVCVVRSKTTAKMWVMTWPRFDSYRLFFSPKTKRKKLIKLMKMMIRMKRNTMINIMRR